MINLHRMKNAYLFLFSSLLPLTPMVTLPGRYRKQRRVVFELESDIELQFNAIVNLISKHFEGLGMRCRIEKSYRKK